MILLSIISESAGGGIGHSCSLPALPSPYSGMPAKTTALIKNLCCFMATVESVMSTRILRASCQLDAEHLVNAEMVQCMDITLSQSA